MDIKAMRVFLSVSDTLNFSRSSEILHMSLSAVSRTIQRLEEELGQILLERDNRRVNLTHHGRQFREYAQKAVDDWQRLRQKLNSETALAGELSLFCSVTASYSVLAPILEAFRIADRCRQCTGSQRSNTGYLRQFLTRVVGSMPSLNLFLQFLCLPVQFA